MSSPISYTISAQEEGMTVGDVLRRRLSVSSSLLRRLKHMPDGITLCGQHVTVRQRVTCGQVLRFLSQGSCTSSDVPAVCGPLDIVFEDEDILVINKPAGLPVHPSRGHYEDTLANRVAWRFAQRGEVFTFRAINRLDKGTSGLLCLAKNQYAARVLCAQLGGGTLIRQYHALVCGSPKPESGVIDLPIGRLPESGIKRAVMDGGQPAVTHYHTLRRGGGYTLLSVRLETGRTHQIRVHFSHIGYPVAGDFMYGRELPGILGHGLHSCQLSLIHPRTGDGMIWRAPDPSWFSSLLVDSGAEKV